MGLLFPGATHSIPKPTFFYAKSLRTLPRPYWKTSIQLYTSTQLKIQSSQNHLGNSKLIQKNAILLYLLTLIGITLNQTHLKSACQSNHYALILGYQIREVSFFFLFFSCEMANFAKCTVFGVLWDQDQKTVLPKELAVENIM